MVCNECYHLATVHLSELGGKFCIKYYLGARLSGSKVLYINSDWMSNVFSGLCIILGYVIYIILRGSFKLHLGVKFFCTVGERRRERRGGKREKRGEKMEREKERGERKEDGNKTINSNFMHFLCHAGNAKVGTHFKSSTFFLPFNPLHPVQ